MAGTAVAHQHTDLEQALAELARAQAQTERGHARRDASLDRLEASLESGFRELRERQAQTTANLDRLSDEMRVFKDEMRVFKDEMATFKAEMRSSSKAADRRWGELANKMGTLAEDIIAPGVPAILCDVFGVEDAADCLIRAWRRDRKDRSRRREFDVVAWAGGVFLVNETKSQVRPGDIPAFLELLGETRSYWPEAEGHKVVGALASFRVDSSVVTAAERAGLLMIGLDTGLLRILNSPGFRPREF